MIAALHVIGLAQLAFGALLLAAKAFVVTAAALVALRIFW